MEKPTQETKKSEILFSEMSKTERKSVIRKYYLNIHPDVIGGEYSKKYSSEAEGNKKLAEISQDLSILKAVLDSLTQDILIWPPEGLEKINLILKSDKSLNPDMPFYGTNRIDNYVFPTTVDEFLVDLDNLINAKITPKQNKVDPRTNSGENKSKNSGEDLYKQIDNSYKYFLYNGILNNVLIDKTYLIRLIDNITELEKFSRSQNIIIEKDKVIKLFEMLIMSSTSINNNLTKIYHFLNSPICRNLLGGKDWSYEKSMVLPNKNLSDLYHHRKIFLNSRNLD